MRKKKKKTPTKNVQCTHFVSKKKRQKCNKTKRTLNIQEKNGQKAMGMVHDRCYGPGSVFTFYELFIKGIFIIWGTLQIFNRLEGTLMQSLAQEKTLQIRCWFEGVYVLFPRSFNSLKY